MTFIFYILLNAFYVGNRYNFNSFHTKNKTIILIYLIVFIVTIISSLLQIIKISKMKQIDAIKIIDLTVISFKTEMK